MNDAYLLYIITTAGWFVGYFTARLLHMYTKRKRITIEYLIDAWRKLEHASNREDNKYYEEIEAAIADIQLFGTKHQIEIAQQLAEQIENGQNGSSLELLLLLREDLRKELKLEKVPNTIKFIRIHK